ncbi:MAG: hypothetical protein J6A25_06055 [Lachnospiraceae bacterium]|nr:hypothetical protein [Lachnospiraceae bacterium]
MQGAKCLNIKNKAVVEDLNKLTSQLGSYEAAYYVLSENDGIMPDSTQLSAILGISEDEHFSSSLDLKIVANLFGIKLISDLNKSAGIDLSTKTIYVPEKITKEFVAQVKSEIAISIAPYQDYFTKVSDETKNKAKETLNKIFNGEYTYAKINELSKEYQKKGINNLEADAITLANEAYVGYRYLLLYATQRQKGASPVTYTKNNLKLSNTLNIYEALSEEGWILTGSGAISNLGSIYRENGIDPHDIDFSKKIDSLSEKIINKFDDRKDNKGEVFLTEEKNKSDLDAIFSILMKDNSFKRIFEKLKKHYKQVDLHRAVIKGGDLTLALDVDGKNIDLFFTNDDFAVRETFDGLKIFDFSKAFSAKLKMRRAKDLNDILNFREPYLDQLNNFTQLEVQDTTPEISNRNKELQTILQKLYPDIILYTTTNDFKDDSGNVLRGKAILTENKIGAVLLNALYENADTLPHEYAHHYIAWFRNSNIVQKGIKLFKSEEELVQAIGENSLKALKWYNRFFNWLKQLFSSKQRVLNELTNAFLSRKDLGERNTNLNEIHYQRMSDISVPYILTKEYDKLLKATKNRINLFTHSTQKVQQNLERLNNLYNTLNKLENDKAVLEFTNYMVEDVNQAFEQLRNYQQQYVNYKKGLISVNPITPEKLDIIKKGTIGFYNNIVTNLRNMLDDPEVIQLYQKLGVYDTFKERLDSVIADYNELVRNYNSLADKVAKDRIIEEATKQGSFSVEELRRKLDEGDDDIGFWDKFVGQTQYSNSEVIRLMLNKMVGAKLKVHDRKLEVGKRLLNLLDKVSKNDLKLLYERDKDGKRTGNLIRDLNYGQHEADYIAHMLKYLDTLNVTVPAGVDFHDIPSILNSDQLKLWNKEKNKWDATHTERKFTPEFYELLEGLSNEAISKKTQIDHDIRMILNPTIDENGKYHREDLSDEDYDRLTSLEAAKRNLSNPFNADGTPKVGTEKEIAAEFAAYNKKLRESLKYKSNKEGWEKARKEAKKNLSPEKYQIWLERNSLDKINERFYEDLSKLSSGKVKTANQVKYEEMRQQLIRLYTIDGKVNVKLMPSKVKQYISTLDFLIAEEARLSPKGQKSRIFEIAKWQVDPNFFVSRDEANRNGKLAEWEAKNGHYNDRGDYVPASFWRKLVPKDELHDKYIDTVPNSSWVEIDKTSPFYNKNFDDTKSESRQPKRSLYDNTANFSKVKGNLKELYDGLVSTLNEANNENLPFLNNSRQYILPQIEGGAMTQILSQDNVLKGLGYAFKDTFTIKDDDTQYNVDKALDPDGSRIRLVPTRYMRKLDNPEALTNDIVGSVIAYYGMAANYNEMSKIAPEMEIMTEFLSRQQFTDSRGGTVVGVKSNTYNKANQMLEQFIYGMEENDMTVDKTIGNKRIQFSVAKAIGNLARFTRLNGMGNNLNVILTGLFTNKIQSRLDAISGIYYDNKALAAASKEVQSAYFSALSGLGKANNTNKVLCFLEWTGTVRNSEETFSKLNQSRWLRALNQHFWWGGYEAADFMTKGKMAVAIAFMYKLDPTTGKFVHKNKFMLRYKDKKQAEVEWDRLNTTIFDAFTVEGNKWVVKPEYAKNVDERTLNIVRNTIKQTGTRIDTQFTDLDKSFVNSNAFCKLIFIYRNFLLINMQTKFITKRHYDYSTDTWQEAQYRGAFNYLWRHYFDKDKINTLKEMYHNYDELDEFERRLLKRVTCEIAFSLVGLFIISSFARAMADDDKDNWFKNLTALIAVRTAVESRSNLLPVETVSMFNSPTAAWGIIEHFGRAFSTLFDEPNKVIKKGAYKGKTRFERSLIKISPFRSIYEMQDPRSKLEYYDNLVSVF